MFDGYTFMLLPYNGKESNVDGKKMKTTTTKTKCLNNSLHSMLEL